MWTDISSYPEGKSHAGLFYLSMNVGASFTANHVGSLNSDHSNLAASHFLIFGGGWYEGSHAGVFCLYVNYDASNTGSGTSTVGSFPTLPSNYILQ